MCNIVNANIVIKGVILGKAMSLSVGTAFCHQHDSELALIRRTDDSDGSKKAMVAGSG
jgi:hypothetical protein